MRPSATAALRKPSSRANRAESNPASAGATGSNTAAKAGCDSRASAAARARIRRMISPWGGLLFVARLFGCTHQHGSRLSGRQSFRHGPWPFLTGSRGPFLIPSSKLGPRMLVDCHVNVFDDNQVLPLFRDLSAITRPGGIGFKSDADTLARELAKVDKAIIFSLRYKDSIGIDGDDEVTARAVAKYPDKFVGFACIDPRMPDCMDLLIHATRDLKLKGVKFGPIYNGVSLLDPRMEPIYAYLERRNLPLTMHMGTTFGLNAPVELGRPVDVDTIARRHPELKMIMAHMAHPWYEECVVVARKCPNVYCEVSAIFYRPWQFWNA